MQIKPLLETGLSRTKALFWPRIKIIVMMIFLVSSLSPQQSSAQGSVTCPAPTTCPNLPGQIIADGNPCEWGLTNLNTFAIKSYRLDAFGSGVVDSQFTQGSKDFDFAKDLKWEVGQTKAKNDIANGAAVLIGSTLYFAGDRTSNNGVAQIGFWFYLGGTAPTTSTLENGTTVKNFAPEHTVGDLFVLADFSAGGRLADVTVLSWVGTGGNVVGSNGTLDSTDCGGIVAINNDTRYLIPEGWGFIRDCYQENEFYEGQIDLTCLLDEGEEAPPLCFSSFLLETRSSKEINSSLDDFVSGAFGGKPQPPTVPAQSRCGAGSVTFTATCTGTDVRWYTTADAVTPITTGGIYTVSADGTQLTINAASTTTVYAACYNAALGCEGDRTAVTATVVNVDPGVIAGSQTLCTPFDPAAFTSTTAGTGGGTITYQWQSSTTSCATGFTNITDATAATYDAPAVAVTTYFRRVATATSGLTVCSANSNCLTVTPNAVTPGSIAGDQTLCSPFNPAAFTSTTAGTGGGAVTYQWQSSTTSCATGFTNITDATSETYDAGAVAVTTYFRRVATSTLNGVLCSANSNCVTVTPNPVTPGSIAGDQTLCTPFNPAAFTSTSAGTGGGAVTYQWQSSTTSCATGFTNITDATSETYDAGAVAVTTYFRRVATSTLNGVLCSANSNCVTVTVNPVTPGTIGGAAPICVGGNPAAFTNVAAGTGGGAVTYQWQSGVGTCETATFANIIGATGPTYDPGVLNETTSYRRIATSTLNGVLCSANSNCITVVVVPNPIIYVPVASPYCAGDPAKGSVTLPNSQTGVNYTLLNDAAEAVPGQPVKAGSNGVPLTWTGLDAGGYLVQASGSGPTNCANLTDPAIVVENPLPNPVADNKEICLGDCVTLTGTPAGGTWSGEGVTGSEFCSAGLSAGPHIVTYTVLNEAGCSSSTTATITVNSCAASICTYTQGQYGTPGGKACDGTVGGLSTEALIAQSLGNLGTLTIGEDGGPSVVVPNTPEAIACIIAVLPGGGSSKELTGVGSDICALPGSYLKNGSINNTLLAQTLTLGLNLGITSPSTLGSFVLQAGVLATAAPDGGCGSNTPIYRTCGPLGVENEYKYRTITAAVVNAIEGAKTVQGLMNLADSALANADGVVGSENGVKLSVIAEAVAAINEVFDECRIFIDWDVVPCPPIVAPLEFVSRTKTVVDESVSVTAFPNPYTDKVRFEIKSAVSGKGTLEVYNMAGQKLNTVFAGQVFAGKGQVIEYKVANSRRANMIYILRVNGRQVVGKLMNIN